MKNGNMLGCTSLTIPNAAAFSKTGPLLAMDAGVAMMLPYVEAYRKNKTDELGGCDRDIQKTSEEIAPVAMRYAGKVDDPEAWIFDWMQRVKVQADELLDSRMFRRGVSAVELKLDAWPTLSGDVVRAVLDEALA